VHHVLAYGTLRCPEIVERLVGRAVPSRPVEVPGWYPAALHGLDFPVLLPDAGATLAADLVGPLQPHEHAALVEWEGPWYVPCAVRVADGSPTGTVATVFFCDSDHPELPPLAGPWSLARFRREDLPGRLQRTWDWD